MLRFFLTGAAIASLLAFAGCNTEIGHAPSDPDPPRGGATTATIESSIQGASTDTNAHHQAAARAAQRVHPQKLDPSMARAVAMLEEGRQTFRFDTFGSEAFWGGTLGLHRAIMGQALGGVGPGVSPKAALGVGLKVDRDAIPPELARKIQAGEVDLDSPASTLALLQIDAVVGVKGFFDRQDRLESVGIQCSLCHSTVDDSFAPGIGRRRDGWPNRDLDVGAIIAMAPDLSFFANHLGVDEPTVRTVLQSWGPGKFDAELILDGKAFTPEGKPAATLLPAAFGLAGVSLHTYTGWGSVAHWNAFVSNLEMQGKGTFYDPRLQDAEKFPLAVKAGFSSIRTPPNMDRITKTLPALNFYQLSLTAPSPPAGSFDELAARRGQAVFEGPAQCATCHVPPIFTEPGWPMHLPEEIGIDSFQANRSPDGRYRTTPLGGLFTRMKGGFYHDGRFPDLAAVVAHYETVLGLALSPGDRNDLIEYLKSL